MDSILTEVLRNMSEFDTSTVSLSSIALLILREIRSSHAIFRQQIIDLRDEIATLRMQLIIAKKPVIRNVKNTESTSMHSTQPDENHDTTGKASSATQSQPPHKIRRVSLDSTFQQSGGSLNVDSKRIGRNEHKNLKDNSTESKSSGIGIERHLNIGTIKPGLSQFTPISGKSDIKQQRKMTKQTSGGFSMKKQQRYGVSESSFNFKNSSYLPQKQPIKVTLIKKFESSVNSTSERRSEPDSTKAKPSNRVSPSKAGSKYSTNNESSKSSQHQNISSTKTQAGTYHFSYLPEKKKPKKGFEASVLSQEKHSKPKLFFAESQKAKSFDHVSPPYKGSQSATNIKSPNSSKQQNTNSPLDLSCIIRNFSKSQHLAEHYKKKYKTIRQNKKLSEKTCDRIKSGKYNHSDYLCTFCDKVFKSKRMLENHVRVHTGAKIMKEFRCKLCKTGFTAKGNARRHLIKIHKLPKCNEINQHFEKITEVHHN